MCLTNGIFNLTGVKVVGCPVFEGRMSIPAVLSGGDTIITDSLADFTPLGSFPDCASFTIEFENGAWGIIEDFTATTITVDDDLTPYICQLEPYIIRQANTLTTLFGSCECLKLQGGPTALLADLIFVPDGTLCWKIYWYSTLTNSWRRIGSILDHCWDPIYFVQGMFILRWDPDGDGIVNLLKYAQRGENGDGVPSSLTAERGAEGRLVASLDIRDDDPNLAVWFEESTDLVFDGSGSEENLLSLLELPFANMLAGRETSLGNGMKRVTYRQMFDSRKNLVRAVVSQQP